MNSENKTCQSCKASFEIDVADFSFYEKIKVPPPTWCPECRMTRRFSFTNIWNLYKRQCTKCSKDIVTIYSPDKKISVYCLQCWWGDDWDGREYAMDYDPSRPFFDQVRELAQKVPYQALENAYLTLKDSDYVNATAHLRNCYLLFWADYCENSFYSTFLNNLKDSLDCYRMKDSELCYESIGCNKCSRTFFSEECDSCSDVWFSRNCVGCINCFGCMNLRNKSYCIWNEQYTREAYLEKLKSFHLESRIALLDLQKRAYKFWLTRPHRMYIGSSLNVGVTGDFIYESKNTRDAYMVFGAEDSRYVQFISVASARNSYDYSGWGNGAELIYESGVVGEGANTVKFSNECWPDVFDVEYSMYAISCKHVFGCMNLKRKQYCILNKEYEKKDYERLVSQIKEDMMKNPYRDEEGRVWPYGEFFPLSISPFAYNETLAHAFFPKNKKEILMAGWKYHEPISSSYKITISGADLPDIISETSEEILKEVISCDSCGKAFRIIQGELILMKRLALPLSRECPNCRHNSRFTRVNPPKLYNRICVKCTNPIKTSYAPDRPEIVYCESCYSAEVV